jgi:acetyl esterase
MPLLDPQAQAILTRAQHSGAPALDILPPEEARQAYRASRLPTQPVPAPVQSRQDFEVPGPAGPVPVRAYRPLGSAATQALPALVFFHGGGWVIGDRDTHDVLCRDLCHLAGCAVFSVDYRLAPEHRFPAAFDDALAVTRWLAQQASAVGVDAARLAVGGDSAGGNLAAGVALALRDAADVRLAAQLLIYPVTDLRCASASYQTCGNGYVLSAADMAYFRGHYIAQAAQYADWRASPLLANDHARLPPALVLAAGCDPLRDEGRQYADCLSAAGNAVQYVCFERQMHGFIGMGGVIDEAVSAVRLCADWLQRILGKMHIVA